jgi:hypothetical protein
MEQLIYLTDYSLFINSNELNLELLADVYCLSSGLGVNIVFKRTDGVSYIVIWIESKENHGFESVLTFLSASNYF